MKIQDKIFNKNNSLSAKQKQKWVYIIVAAFIVLNTYLIANESYWASIIPVVLIILLLYIFSIDKLILLITFFTPLAVNIKDIDIGTRISLPTEPLMFAVLLLFIIKLFYHNNFDKKFLKHPVTIAIIINLIWIFFTSITSDIPIVSFKFFISRLWFVVPFYFIGTQMFKKQSNIKIFTWAYVIPLLAVIVYTIYNHSLQGFTEDSAHWVVTPFYNDHTAYGAALAFFIPVFIGYTFDKKYSKSIKIASFIVFIILVAAIILSFCRAAWISLLIALLAYLFILLKIKFKWILLVLAILIGFFYIFQFQIIDKLERNKKKSSANIIEHIESISNITSDASNLERVNRWKSAIRMFNERPFFGWGPGTYQFEYAPFQQSKEKTIISTNEGDKGNAHSEYLGPLAESGLIGMLSVIAIVICVIYTALKVYKKAADKEVRLLTLLTLLGLITYYSHGLLNNFLDTDKASVPFWGFTAIIVALDIYNSKKNNETVEKITNSKQ